MKLFGKSHTAPTEGYDVINFGSTGAQGKTQGMAGVGFRSNLTNTVLHLPAQVDSLLRRGVEQLSHVTG